MNKLKVYLAGTRKNPWRAEVLEECGDCPIEFLSPSAAVHKTFQIEDALKIEWADILFAYLQEGSSGVFSGTSFEVGYAYHGGKKIILVCDMRPTQSHLYDLVLATAHVTYPTLSDGIDGLRHMAFSMQYLPKKE